MSLSKRLRDEAVTWPLGGISGRRQLLDDVAEYMEKLEADLVGVRHINRLLAECMAESQDLIRRYKDELQRLREEGK